METSKYITRHLDRLLLDPNNYRFIDHRDYRKVPTEQIADNQIQLRTFNLLVGKNYENIRDLVGSFKANGILKLDPLQVKEIDDGKYIVIEGNRRTAALKHLYEELKLGNDVGKLTQESFKSVEVVLTSGESPVQHLITMGLHHISGKRKWSPVNQAQLIHDLRWEHFQSEDDIMETLGISKQSLRRDLRTLAIINEYKASDYGDQFHPTKYSIFEEVIKTPKVKEWLGWDDEALACTDVTNQQRLFSWISEEEIPAGEHEAGGDLIVKEPIITKSHEIRELGKFVQDEAAVAKMEESRSITTGFALSEAVAEQKFKNAIDNLGKDVNIAFQFNEFMAEDDLERIQVLRNKIDSLIPSSKAVLEKKDILQIESIHAGAEHHFEHFEVISFCKLEALKFTTLSRVNIVAGGNNVGKTSLLESIYLATQLNNLAAFVEQQRFRGKFYRNFRAYWLNKSFTRALQVAGKFNGGDMKLCIDRVEDAITADKTHYLASISAKAEVGSMRLESLLHLFNNREPEEFYELRRMLCPAAFTSPFRFNEDQLSAAYDQALSSKLLNEVIAFIREQMDPRIEAIDMSSDKRFLVTSTQFGEAIDITRFGEGLQRVFEIALLLVRARNGVLCIDEFDAAIHKSLLVAFTKFVQEAAEKFNVQVFLSTHSKECIDAFVVNGFHNRDVTAHILSEKEGVISARFLDGTKLEGLVNSIDIDIR